MPESSAFDTYLQQRARKLRSDDRPPASLAGWKKRREDLRKKMFAAMGPLPRRRRRQGTNGG